MSDMNIDIRLVTSVPEVIAPSTLYMVKQYGCFVWYMSDRLGEQLVPCRSPDEIHNLNDLLPLGMCV